MDMNVVARKVRAARQRAGARKPLTIEAVGRPRGRALLSCILGGFSDRGGDPLRAYAGASKSAHTNYTEAVLIAGVLADLGYRVDVIDFRNHRFVPSGTYDVLVDPRHNMERLAPLVGEDCRKILHMDTANILYQNATEARRLLEIQQRRGTSLTARRYEDPRRARAIEVADAGVHLGNGVSAETYAYAEKPLFQARLFGVRSFPSPAGRDFERSRRRFLWLGSHGLALKGLDLALEAFAQMPEHELFICGPVETEPDFAAAFRPELTQPNIHAVGWVDVESERFERLVASCIGLVYPSFSEGCAGAAVTALHAGLLPIVSRETSVDLPDGVGTVLQENSASAIQEAVHAVAQTPATVLEEQSVSAWRFAAERHTTETFARQYREAAEEVTA